MKKIDIFDILFKSLLLVVALVCILYICFSGRLRDGKPAAQMDNQAADSLATSAAAGEPSVDCECYPDSVVEDGYGTYYHHPGQDPEWTTSK